MARWTLACAFLLAFSLAGCVDGNRGPPPSHWNPNDLTATCDGAQPAMLLLELHTDHSGGDSEYWHIAEEGTWTILRGVPRIQEYRLVAFESWTGPDLQALCPAIAAFDRPNPYTGSIWQQNLTLSSAEITTIPDVARLAPHVEEGFALNEDSSAHCRSGGDTWMLLQSSSSQHVVDATCHHDEAFGAWLTEFYEIVERRPFEDVLS